MSNKNEKYSDMYDGSCPQPVAYEQEKPKPIVIYNAEGQPLTKPVQRMGFDLTPDKK